MSAVACSSSWNPHHGQMKTHRRSCMVFVSVLHHSPGAMALTQPVDQYVIPALNVGQADRGQTQESHGPTGDAMCCHVPSATTCVWEAIDPHLSLFRTLSPSLSPTPLFFLHPWETVAQQVKDAEKVTCHRYSRQDGVWPVRVDVLEKTPAETVIDLITLILVVEGGGVRGGSHFIPSALLKQNVPPVPRSLGSSQSRVSCSRQASPKQGCCHCATQTSPIAS